MSEIIDWRTKSVAELREVLKNIHIDISGTKAILVARLDVNQEAGVCDRMREEIRKLEEEIRHHGNLEAGHEEEATGRVRSSPDRYSDRPTDRHPDWYSDRHRERAPPDRTRESEFVETDKDSNRRESPTNPVVPNRAGSVQRNTIGDTLLLAVFRRQEAVKVWMTVPRNGAMNNDRHTVRQGIRWVRSWHRTMVAHV